MAAPTSRSRAFFLELILDIVAFTICAIISVQVFIEARSESDQSSALSHLSIEAQIVAETFKASDGDVDKMLSSLDKAFNTTFQDPAAGPDVTSQDPATAFVIVRYYDSSFTPVANGADSRYLLRCMVSTLPSGIKVADITVFSNDVEIYSLEVSSYRGEAYA